MKLNSLGLRSELIFPSFEGDVKDCGDYVRIRTPLNPNYWWGNYLLFEHAPQTGDFERWTHLFAQEIGTPPQTNHMVFAWDDLTGKQGVFFNTETVAPFLEAGFKLVETVVQTATKLTAPKRPNTKAELRILETDDDFKQRLELHILSGLQDDGFEENGYRDFQEKKLASDRRMIAAGLGNWFGAFINSNLVASMGLFWQNATFLQRDIARYQHVVTHPDYRKQGLASTLTYFVGNYGLTEIGVKTLVIMADEDYFAKDIYASLGFKRSEVLAALERAPKEAPSR